MQLTFYPKTITVQKTAAIILGTLCLCGVFCYGCWWSLGSRWQPAQRLNRQINGHQKYDWYSNEFKFLVFFRWLILSKCVSHTQSQTHCTCPITYADRWPDVLLNLAIKICLFININHFNRLIVPSRLVVLFGVATLYESVCRTLILPQNELIFGHVPFPLYLSERCERFSWHIQFYCIPKNTIRIECAVRIYCSQKYSAFIRSN